LKTAEWRQRHQRDVFVKQARRDKYVSRAAYKLLEIAEKTRLFRWVNHTILDLGAAPGGWSQVAAQLAPHAKIIAVDLLPMEPVKGVISLCGDLLENETWERIDIHADGKPIDLILSDMSANLSGVKAVDQARNQAIYELLLDIASTRLATNGAMLCKLFSGEAEQSMRKAVAGLFAEHKILKPAASRNRSAEIYLWAKTIANR